MAKVETVLIKSTSHRILLPDIILQITVAIIVIIKNRLDIFISFNIFLPVAKLLIKKANKNANEPMFNVIICVKPG
jgi:hypothetical protein